MTKRNSTGQDGNPGHKPANDNGSRNNTCDHVILREPMSSKKADTYTCKTPSPRHVKTPASDNIGSGVNGSSTCKTCPQPNLNALAGENEFSGSHNTYTCKTLSSRDVSTPKNEEIKNAADCTYTCKTFSPRYVNTSAGDNARDNIDYGLNGTSTCKTAPAAKTRKSQRGDLSTESRIRDESIKQAKISSKGRVRILIVTDLPDRLPILPQEIALIGSYLSDLIAKTPANDN